MCLKLFSSVVCSLITLFGYWYWQSLKKINYIPGYRLLFSPAGLPGALLPTSSWNLGYSWPWVHRHKSFFNFSHDIISIVPILSGKPTLYTCSVDVLKQLLGNENKLNLVKPLDITLHRLWGDSLAASSGEVWRRHRRAVAPAFHSKIFETAAVETENVYREMTRAKKWNDRNEIFLPEVNHLLLKFTLLMIGRCGFGVPMTWYDERNEVDQTTFEYSARVAAETLIARFILPSWAFKLPIKRLQHIGRSWDHFTRYIQDYIHDSRATESAHSEESEEFGYILRRLIESSREGAGKYILTEKEVMADMFTMMFAGHETTASVLAATLGYLSIYQDEQKKAYSEVAEHMSQRGNLASDDSLNFPHLTACFIEAGRLFPAALMLARTMPEDTPVKVKHPSEQTIVLPQGSRLIFELVGIFRNPNTYKNPDKFIPSRWYGVPEAEIPMFGTGPRACIGRRFAMMEAVKLLSYMLLDWKLDIELREGETRADYESRIMGKAGRQGTAFSVGPVPLKLIRRCRQEY